MARVWQEELEHGMPNTDYLQGDFYDTQISDLLSTNDASLSGAQTVITNGRNSFSKYSLCLTGNAYFYKKLLTSTLSELYLRMYINFLDITSISSGDTIYLKNTSNNIVASIYFTSTAVTFRIRIGGTLTAVYSPALNTSQWYKIEFYVNTNSSTGAYEIRIDNINVASGSGLNLGGSDINSFELQGESAGISFCIDDIAINDTTGAVNNSWCGDGTIVGLKPNGAGNSTQWDTSEGYASAEGGTTTTNIKITGHGLATNDVVYNKTRDVYRLITKVDNDNFTVATVTGQTTGDQIIMFTYDSQYTAASGTTTSLIKLPSAHTTDSYDVFVNTTRSNAIRRIIYDTPDTLYNSAGGLGSTVTSQAAGDTIKVNKVHFYTMSHYLCVANERPNKQISRIRSTTSGDIDLFDMQELVSDKSVPSTSDVIAISIDITCQDNNIGGSEIIPVLRSGTTNSEQTGIPLSTDYRTRRTILENSPFTTASWTVAEIDGIEAGVKVS